MIHRKIFGGVAALLLVASVAQPVSAQRVGRWMFNGQYSTAMGVGETADFAGDFSFRGVTIDVKRMQSDNLALGLTFGWHVLDEQAITGTNEFPAGAVSGTRYKYVNSVPILAIANYYLGTSGTGVRPFIGVGGGTYYIENRTEVGVFAVENDNWHFGALGEAGLYIVPQPGAGAMTLSARFNWGFEADGVERQYVTFSIGFASDR